MAAVGIRRTVTLTEIMVHGEPSSRPSLVRRACDQCHGRKVKVRPRVGALGSYRSVMESCLVGRAIDTESCVRFSNLSDEKGRRHSEERCVTALTLQEQERGRLKEGSTAN